MTDTPQTSQTSADQDKRYVRNFMARSERERKKKEIAETLVLNFPRRPDPTSGTDVSHKRGGTRDQRPHGANAAGLASGRANVSRQIIGGDNFT